MALKFSRTFDYGFTSVNAYAKIENIQANKDVISFQVFVFYSKTARDAEKQPIEPMSFEMNMPIGTGNDLMVDLYNHLKTLPEFDGAVDV